MTYQDSGAGYHYPDHDDPNLLFEDDDDGFGYHHPQDSMGGGSRSSRHQERRVRARRRRRRRFAALVAFGVVVVAVVVGVVVVRPMISRSSNADYSGAGTGSVRVRIKPNDTASDIGATLHDAGVVRSVGAFTNAAKSNPQSISIQPGLYQMRLQMSGASAVAMLLDPNARLTVKVVIPEGSTTATIVGLLADALKIPKAQVQQVMADVEALGLPAGYEQKSGAAPTSAVGFLFPDTYTFDADATPSDALQQRVSEYVATDRSQGCSTAVGKLGLTPYDGLTIASMIEREVQVPEDRAKVARVILNRLKKKMPLGVDAASIYGAVLAGLDPAKVDYATLDSPYNTYTHTGLPPSPIGNPGGEAMTAAAEPAAGNWLYYVNSGPDDQNRMHLAFFDTDGPQWQAAVQKCYQNHWGCAAP
ncbi:MAG: endolytic transglycosylase MltG [Actinomycetia bacterium]|nr:endolytic transglycosylase MltG [Actinomycetes bacterium]